MSKAGLLGFFGAAGLAPKTVEAAIDRLLRSLPDSTFVVNLIHSPNEPSIEASVADLLIRRRIPLVEASSYLGLTLRVLSRAWIHRAGPADVRTASSPKVSRAEVASVFCAAA